MFVKTYPWCNTQNFIRLLSEVNTTKVYWWANLRFKENCKFKYYENIIIQFCICIHDMWIILQRWNIWFEIFEIKNLWISPASAANRTSGIRSLHGFFSLKPDDTLVVLEKNHSIIVSLILNGILWMIFFVLYIFSFY